MLNSVVKISMMSAKYFEYYTFILRGAFSWTRCISEDKPTDSNNIIDIEQESENDLF